MERVSTGFSELLYALRSAPESNEIFSAELQLGRKITIEEDILTTKPNNFIVSEIDNNFEWN